MKKQKIALSLLALCIYGTLFLMIPRPSFWVRDNGHRFILIEELKNKTNQSNQVILNSPSLFLDPQFQFFSIKYPFAKKTEKGMSSQYPLIYPKFLKFLINNFSVDPLIISLISIYAMCLILIWGSYDKKIIFIYSIFCFLGTPLLFYGFVLWEISLAILLAVIGMQLLKSRKWCYLSSLFFALSIVFRLEMVLFIISLVILTMFKKERRVIHGFIILVMSAIGAFSFFLMNTGYEQILNYYIDNQQNVCSSLSEYFKIKANVLHHLIFSNGFSDKKWSHYIIVLFIILFKWLRKEVSLVMIILLTMINCGIMLFSKDYASTLIYGNGLILTWPAFLLIIFLPLKKSEQLVLLIYFIITIFTCPYITSFGIHWGPRILLGLVPFYLLILKDRFVEFYLNYKKYVTMIVFLSVFLQLTSIHYLLERKNQNYDLIKTVHYFDNSIPIITTLPWLSEELAPLFHSRLIFYLREKEKIDILKIKLLNEGFDQVLLITKESQELKSYNMYHNSHNRFKIFNIHMELLNLK